jgi:hypothetical protein
LNLGIEPRDAGPRRWFLPTSLPNPVRNNGGRQWGRLVMTRGFVGAVSGSWPRTYYYIITFLVIWSFRENLSLPLTCREFEVRVSFGSVQPTYRFGQSQTIANLFATMSYSFLCCACADSGKLRVVSHYLHYIIKNSAVYCLGQVGHSGNFLTKRPKGDCVIEFVFWAKRKFLPKFSGA